jgi:hypothetical protein
MRYLFPRGNHCAEMVFQQFIVVIQERSASDQDARESWVAQVRGARQHQKIRQK